MFRRNHRLATAGAAVAVALVLTSCSGGGAATSDRVPTFDPTEPITLDFAFWGNDVRAKMYDQALAAFHEEHPSITVRSTFVSFPEFWEKRQTEAAGHNLPDVMQFSEQYLRQYTQSGLLLDLTPYLGNLIETDGFEDEAFLKLGEVDGVTSGIATSVNTWGLFTNTGLLDGTGAEPFAGGSWSDYEQWLSTVTDAGSVAGTYGGSDWTGRIQNFELQLRAEGGALFEEDGTVGFDKERLAEFWQSGGELRDGVAVPQVQLEESYPLTALDTGLAATELNWDNFGAGYMQNLGVSPDQISLIAPPVTVEGARDMYFKSSMLHTISANTEHPEAAALLVDFLVNSPTVGEIFGASRGMPASATQLAGVELTGIDAQVQEYEASVADRIGDPPPVPIVGYGTIEEKFRQIGIELGLGTMTVDEAVDRFFAEMDVILDS